VSSSAMPEAYGTITPFACPSDISDDHGVLLVEVGRAEQALRPRG
jgi:hypothetical protein